MRLVWIGNGEIAKRWPLWLVFAVLFYGAILLLVYATTIGSRISPRRPCGGK